MSSVAQRTAKSSTITSTDLSISINEIYILADYSCPRRYFGVYAMVHILAGNISFDV